MPSRRYDRQILSLEQLLKDVGIKSETLNSVRLGPGVVGRSATVTAVALIVLAVAAYKLNNEYLLFATVCLAVLICVGFCWWAMRYADRNPGAALLEGAELVTWRMQELASKSIHKLPNTPEVSDPSAPLTTGLPIEGPDRDG
ncbi:MAG: hypothetical protein ABIU05_06950 [Nitrospirales bacterium]